MINHSLGMMYKPVPNNSNQKNDIYDQMAPHYRAYAEQKSVYIDAVNKAILDNLPSNLKSMLDIGAGDGVRAFNLARAANIENLVLLEPSSEMVRLCTDLPVSAIWHGTADSLPASYDPLFDLITCLWNVMGHMPDTESRVRALRKMSALLAPGGRIMLDVNNRHNTAAYGKFTVFGRRLLDAIKPDERRGDVSFSWNINGVNIPANGHLFIPSEMMILFRNAGLRLTKSYAIDYKSGARTTDLTKGQMFFILEK